MVIQGSTELLRKIPNATTEAQRAIVNKAIARIDYAGHQMKTLTETFLLLGKEQIESQHYGQFDLASRLEQILAEMAQHFAKQEIKYTLRVTDSATISAPRSFIDIVIGNLIKNAFNYSVGNIDITLKGGLMQIHNPLSSQGSDNAGYGCGLIIIDRICERMGWQFSTQSDDANYGAFIQFVDHER
jgi:signal transduction histidine kinase